MRRAAAKAFRTSLPFTARGLHRSHQPYRHISLLSQSVSCLQCQHHHLHHHHYQHNLLRLRSLFTSPASRLPSRPFSTPHPQLGEPLRSSMYVRRASVALVSGLVGFGAYYAYQGEGGPGFQGSRAVFSTKIPTAATASTAGVSGTEAAAAAAAATSSAAAQPTRNVLVIGANELSTGTLVGDGPISKMVDNVGRRVLEMLSPEQATERLRKNEESYAVNRGKGVLRYDLVQLASNDPIEDDHAEKIVEVPYKSSEADGNTSDWMFWGVFDGHSGWTTSAKLRQTLINYVATELNDAYKAAPVDGPAADTIEGAIKSGFTRLDDDIVNKSAQKVLGQKSKSVAAELLAPALSGSCALLSFYDSKSKLLRVACTGDSRAVLGRRSATTGKWTATPLSVDQTGSNPDEASRLRQLHPGEDHVVRNGRVLGGLEPTRAFGDASYKWTRDVSDRLRQSFFGRSQSPLMRTPPYVTAEPVVTTTKIEPEQGDFIVMATDGLWEMLTNEEAVGLVGKWLEAEAASRSKSGGGSSGSSSLDSAWARVFGGGSGRGSLPVDQPPEGSTNNHGERTPIRLRQWGISAESTDRFLVKDKNAATHLVRNALGGQNEEQVSALLTLPAPFSRRYRDDLTVQVIFFGNGNRSGDVVVNQEATGPAAAIRAKL